VQVTIPRWAQAVGAPLVVLLAVFAGRAVGHALFVFLLAALVALLLNPLVEALRRLRVPRPIGAPLVYLTFLAIIVVLFVVGLPPLMRQGRGLVERAPEWIDQAGQRMTSFQTYLDNRNIAVDLQALGKQLSDWLQTQGLKSAGTVLNFGVGVVGGLATFVLMLFVSFYMLVDGRRITRYLARMLPGDDATMHQYLNGLQISFTRFVKGQSLLGLSVGLAAGLGVWSLGWDVVGIWPEGSQYALLFGVWAGITEVIPYVGPWLGAFPPVVLALFHSPVTALWVALIFFIVQMLENHILVPNIMGATVGVHPLVVMFALLAAAEVGGILGMLAVLPLLALVKHTLTFFDLRLSKAPWIAEDGVIPVPADPSGSSGTGPIHDAQDAGRPVS
jgi:predicted PurR-regulated permease PerM